MHPGTSRSVDHDRRDRQIAVAESEHLQGDTLRLLGIAFAVAVTGLHRELGSAVGGLHHIAGSVGSRDRHAGAEPLPVDRRGGGQPVCVAEMGGEQSANGPQTRDHQTAEAVADRGRWRLRRR